LHNSSGLGGTRQAAVDCKQRLRQSEDANFEGFPSRSGPIAARRGQASAAHPASLPRRDVYKSPQLFQRLGVVVDLQTQHDVVIQPDAAVLF
jgi:hypothetical protein